MANARFGRDCVQGNGREGASTSLILAFNAVAGSSRAEFRRSLYARTASEAGLHRLTAINAGSRVTPPKRPWACLSKISRANPGLKTKDEEE